MSLHWHAVDGEGNVLHIIPLHSRVYQLQGWIAGQDDSLTTLDIPEGAEARAFIRRSSEMGGTTHTGYHQIGQSSVLALSWSKGDEEDWLWLFEDGTVARTHDDPGERQWGWEDFTASVAKLSA